MLVHPTSSHLLPTVHNLNYLSRLQNAFSSTVFLVKKNIKIEKGSTK